MGLRRSWRELRAGWVRYLALVLLVTMGVGVVVAFTAGNVAILDALAVARADGRLADGEFATVAPLSERQRADVAALGVELADARYLDSGPLRLFAVPTGLNLPLTTAGRTPRASGEIWVERLHAAARGVRLGDRIGVANRTFTVVGTGSLPHYAHTVRDPDDAVTDLAAFGPALVTRADLDALVTERPDDVVWSYAYRLAGASEARLRDHLTGVTADPDAARNPLLERALRHAAARGVPVTYSTLDSFLPTDRNPRVTSAADEALLTARLALAAGALVLLLVGYVLAAVNGDRIARESATIGALYALGLGRARVTGGYLILPLAVTGFGSAAGVAVGHAWAPVLSGTSVAYYSLPEVDFGPRWPVVAAGLGLPLLVVAGVNLVALRRSLRRTPVALLRPAPTAGAGSRLRLAGWPFGLAFRLRQTLRSLGSHGLLAAGLALSILLLVLGLGMQASIAAYGPTAAREVRYGHAYALRFPDLDRLPAGAQPAVAVALREVPSGGAVTLLGIDPGNPFFDADVAGLRPHDVVVTEGVAVKYGVGVGDPLTLREADGELAWAFTIVAVVPGTPVQAFTSRAHATALLDPAAVGFLADLSSAGWLATGGPPPAAPADASARFYNMVFSAEPLDLPAERVASHTTRADVLRGVDQFEDMLGGTVGSIVAAALVVCVLVLYVLIRMIVGRQGYAIALMKAFGYSEREVARLYLNTYGWLVAVVLAAGLPLSVAVMRVVWRQLLAHAQAGIPFGLPPGHAAGVAGLTLAAYGAVRLASAAGLRRVPVTEILKARE